MSDPEKIRSSQTPETDTPRASLLASGVSTLITLIKDFFVDIFRYREYLKQSVARDLRRRYKRSVLGYFWSMLNPLIMMVILAVVFSNIMRQNIDDYAVFLFAGMLPFTYFNATATGCLATIRANASIIDQVAVPKYIFPLSVGFSALIDFLLSILPLLLVMIVFGRPVEASVLFLPILLMPMFFVAMGVGLCVAVSNVFFEDTQHLVDVAFRALYFLCPVLYARELLPEWLQHIVVLNPMFLLVEFNRAIFYGGTLPPMGIFLLNFTGSLLLLAAGLWVFKKTERKFVYHL